MGRKTVQNTHYDENVWKSVNSENKYLLDEFVAYLHSIDRSNDTVFQYTKDLQGFFCWYHTNYKDKEFYDIKKREIMRYQNYLLNELQLSPSRIRRLKASLSSLSNFIVKILDEEYPEFKNIINLIEAPQRNAVRQKTVLSEEQLELLLKTLIEQDKPQIACYFAILASSGMRKAEAFRLKMSDFDEEYPEFKNIINLIEAPQRNAVRQKTVLSEEQLELLLKTLVEQDKPQIACYFAILASSGMRKAEAFRLKMSDFDEDKKVSDGVYKSTPIKTKGRGKNGKTLSKYFLISILEPYLTQWKEKRAELEIDNEYLFANKNGKLNLSAGDYWCEIATKILDVPVYSHSLRHYLTSYMSKNNVPAKIIQEYFGWSSSAMIDIYDDNEAEDSFSEYFSSEGIKKSEANDINSL